MILVDSNILIYAYNNNSREHESARKWLGDSLTGAESICFTWITLMSFIRVSTNKKLFVKPYSASEAFSVVEHWLSAPNSVLISPGSEHLALSKKLAIDSKAYGPDLTDVHLAAIAIENDAKFATTDDDFKKFKGLNYFNPLTV